jgi:hypothetical protein
MTTAIVGAVVISIVLGALYKAFEPVRPDEE